jgi:guanine nucleotide-binding protein G(i) subunit alpha
LGQAHIFIFVTSLNDYNNLCFEDDKTNRMEESLSCFSMVVNNNSFKDCPVILLLNKCDLFEQKIPKFPLKETFSDYDGEDDVGKAYDFVEKKFRNQEKNPTGNRIFSFKLIGVNPKKVQEIYEEVMKKLDELDVSKITIEE